VIDQRKNQVDMICLQTDACHVIALPNYRMHSTPGDAFHRKTHSKCRPSFSEVWTPISDKGTAILLNQFPKTKQVIF
jgi:hypothetical protein